MPANVVTSIEKVWSDEIKDGNWKAARHNALNIRRNASPVLPIGVTAYLRSISSADREEAFA
jgi:hypothetical protein